MEQKLFFRLEHPSVLIQAAEPHSLRGTSNRNRGLSQSGSENKKDRAHLPANYPRIENAEKMNPTPFLQLIFCLDKVEGHLSLTEVAPACFTALARKPFRRGERNLSLNQHLHRPDGPARVLNLSVQHPGQILSLKGCTSGLTALPENLTVGDGLSLKMVAPASPALKTPWRATFLLRVAPA